MCKTMHLSVAGLVLEKERLESVLAQDIAALIAHFHDTTGLGVRQVDCSFVDTTDFSSKSKCYRLAGVQVTTNLI